MPCFEYKISNTGRKFLIGKTPVLRLGGFGHGYVIQHYLFDAAYASGVHSAVKVDVVVGDYFNHFSVFAFAAYGFFFSLRKL